MYPLSFSEPRGGVASRSWESEHNNTSRFVGGATTAFVVNTGVGLQGSQVRQLDME